MGCTGSRAAWVPRRAVGLVSISRGTGSARMASGDAAREMQPDGLSGLEEGDIGYADVGSLPFVSSSFPALRTRFPPSLPPSLFALLNRYPPSHLHSPLSSPLPSSLS